MLNDYVSITTAEVIDLKFDISVVLDSSQNQGAVVSEIINVITNYFDPGNIELGSNVYISDIRRNIQSINGVISLANVEVFNLVGGQYSSSQTSQRYAIAPVRQIELIDDTIFAQPNQIYQVRFPGKDILVRVKNQQTVNFS
jgi:hypothetical protein